MGKNAGHKAQQRQKYAASESAPGEGDQTVDATWHSPEWHAARIASLQVQRMSWEDFKQKKKDSEAMEAQAEMAQRDYRAQLDAERALRLGRVADKGDKTKDKKDKGKKRSKSKEKRKKSKDGKKEKRRKEDRKKRSKKRKRSGRSDGDSSSSRSAGSSGTSSGSSSDSSDSDSEAATKRKAKRSKGPMKLSEYLAAD